MCWLRYFNLAFVRFVCYNSILWKFVRFYAWEVKILGNAFFNAAFEEDLRTRNARDSVMGIREEVDDVLIFDRDGEIYAVRSNRGALRTTDNISRYMPVSEWNFLLEYSLHFSCERVLIDTKLGAMLVCCSMAASMRIMIGIIFHGDRRALLAQYPDRITSLTRVSPRMRDMEGRHRLPEEDVRRAEQLAALVFRAFVTAGVKNRLLQCPQEATAQLIDRACRIAELIGCRLDCRSGRSAVPNLQNFNLDAYIAMLTCLMLFVADACPSRSFEMKLGDLRGAIYPILRCEPDFGADELFMNRRYRHKALYLCDGIAHTRDLLFDCSMRTDADGFHLLVRFLPSIKPVEKLGVKKPGDKIDYSDMPE